MTPEPASAGTLPPGAPAASATPARWSLPWPAWAILLLSAALACVWSHFKLLSQDEMFVLQTDSVPTLHQVVRIQLHYPISLDPLVFHTLAHLGTLVFGATATALRAPALLGYLLLQVCLFFTVRRIAGDRAGIFAMAVTALAQTFFYAAEGRPYGLLLGFAALVLLAWQTATRALPGQRRTGSLLTLALALALLLNTHYFAVLLLIPLCGAELLRTLTRRRLDWPVLFAIAAGMAGIAAALPFQHAAAEFRKHYYNAGAVGLRAITQAYRSLFVDYTHTSATTQRAAAMLFVIAAAALLTLLVNRWRRGQLRLPAGEAAFLTLLALLPFFGFLLARFVTHSIEVRYVLGAIIGLAALIGLVLAPAFHPTHNPALGPRDTVWNLTVAILLGAILATGWLRIHNERAATAATLAELQLPSAVRDAVLGSPSGRLYIQNMGRFEIAQFYQPDLEIRRRTTLVWSSPDEIQIDGHDTEALTAEHMLHFTALPITDYNDLKAEAGPHIFLLYHSGWDFTDQALAADHALIHPLPPAAGADAASITFPH